MAQVTEAAGTAAALERLKQKRRRSAPRQVLHLLVAYPVLPGFILLMVAFAGVFGSYLYPTDPIKQVLTLKNVPPTYGRVTPYNLLPADDREHLDRSQFMLGGDPVGRDIFSRIIGGARITLEISVISLGTGLLLGASMGIVAGYLGGWVDELITRLVDMWRSIPFILVALVVAGFWSPKSSVVMLMLLSLVAWPPFVRQVRADVLVLRSRDYISSAKIAGASNMRIMLKHILPGTYSTILVVASLTVGGLILTEAGLSFLGAGIPDPIPTWGKSVADGRQYIGQAPHVIFWPGLALFLVVMSFNFLGDWLRDKLDPRLRQLD